jgi:hypothetical protein
MKTLGAALPAPTALIIFLLLSASVGGAVVYVDRDAPGPGHDGESWDTAFVTIQEGASAANPGGEVWVADGAYAENVVLGEYVRLYGGFLGAEPGGYETSLGQRDFHSHITTINGRQLGSCVTMADGATLDGFTLTNGNAYCGAGVYCDSITQTAVIANNVITHNWSGGGTAVYCTYSVAVVTGNTMSDNVSRSNCAAGVLCENSSYGWISDNLICDNTGCGIHCEYNSSVIVVDNTIARNSTESGNGAGVGIFLGSSGVVVGNLIIGNSAWSGGGIRVGWAWCDADRNLVIGNRAHDGDGGGVRIECSTGRVTNSVIAGNAAYGSGGGVDCALADAAEIVGNTIVANSAPSAGGIQSNDGTKVVNNIVAFGTSGIRGAGEFANNCVYGNDEYNYATDDPTGTNGNISVDPLLAGLTYGDVHLQPGSPCIGAGQEDYSMQGQQDIDGQPRVQGEHVDIGADESDGTLWDVVPAVVRVATDGDDRNDGSSWQNPKMTVGSAITAASSLGGEVWVKAGVYHERIALLPFAYVYGGFAGDEKSRDERDRDANEAVLDGDQGGSVVTMDRGLGFSAIDGFTIRNGKASAGGGIYCDTASPLIAHNTITGNTAEDPYSGGGGIYCQDASPMIVSNRITLNTASDSRARGAGGGIYARDSSPTIIANTIADNRGAQSGGGVLVMSCGGVVAGNVIADNVTSRYGGGIDASSAACPIVSNTLVGNTAVFGGGICGASCSPTVANNIIAFGSSGIYWSGSSPTLLNNCLYGNTEYDYKGIPPGGSDISLDPALVDPANGDYHLSPLSPCIDSGANDAPGLPYQDFDGDPRVCDGNGDGIAVVDIGADEYRTEYERSAAPAQWFVPGWVWFSIPLNPRQSADASQVLGFDAGNRVFGWDEAARTFRLYPLDFTDLVVGVGYAAFLRLGEAYAPVYEGSQPGLPFERLLVSAGWCWVGVPSTQQIRACDLMVRKDGVTRSAAEDSHHSAPWLNWNWIYWNPVTRGAEIMDPFGTGDDDRLRPWRGYFVWANTGGVTIVFP